MQKLPLSEVPNGGWLHDIFPSKIKSNSYKLYHWRMIFSWPLEKWFWRQQCTLAVCHLTNKYSFNTLTPNPQKVYILNFFQSRVLQEAQQDQCTIQLDESTAHRHLKSPQSLCGRSVHLNMVTVMVMNDLPPTPLLTVNHSSHSETQLFQNLILKILGQCNAYGQRSHLTWKIQRSRSLPRSNPLVTFEV